MGFLKSLILFCAVAIVAIVVADRVLFVSKPDGKAGVQAVSKPPPTYVVPENGQDYFEAPVETAKKPEPPAEAVPAPVPTVMVPPAHGSKPRIAIVIDDIGMDVRRSRAAINDLPAAVTMAVLPYAPKARDIAAEAKAQGHSLIIHTPMEAMDGKVNIGPGGLHAGMDGAAFDAAFGVMLNSFGGYEGINNHMGSRLTQDAAAMDRIMNVLKARGLFFLDSKTSEASVAAQEAAKDGVPFAERDVFLDHEDTPEFVASALLKAEKVARKKGYAIAIGHPKDHTLAGLKVWIPTLEAKGIELVPVRELLVR